MWLSALDLWVAITLAPRTDPTIDRVVDSMEGINNIHIFAEPGTYLLDKRLQVHSNKEKLWCFKNWMATLQSMVDRKYEYIRITQDDMLVNKEWFDEALKFIDHKDDIAINCYTSIRQQMYSGIVYKKWWNINDRGWNTRWASFLFPREVAIKLLNSKFLRSHMLWREANQQVDNAVSQALEEIGVTQWMYNPSITTHIWGESTIDHKDFFVNQRCDAPCEPIYAYCLDWATMPNIENHVDHIVQLNSKDHKGIMEHITNTPWYWIILAPYIDYPETYVIKCIRDLKGLWNKAILSHRWYFIKPDEVDEKAANHWLKQPKRVNFTHYAGMAFYWSTLYTDKEIDYKKDLSHTINKLIQQKRAPIQIPAHEFWFLNFTGTKPLYEQKNRPIDKESIQKDQRTLSISQ